MNHKFTKPNTIGKLENELTAAISKLRPGTIEHPTYGTIYDCKFTVLRSGDDIFLDVPDDVTSEELASVINAHVKDPDPTPIDFGDAEDIDNYSKKLTAVNNLKAYMALSSPNNAQTIAVIKLLCKIAIFFIKRV